MFVSAYKRGTKEWWSDRLDYRMDGLDYPIFLIGIIGAAIAGFQDDGLIGLLKYGMVAFVVSEVIMRIAERYC